MFYTLPQAIKEEKEDEERVGNLDSKREKAESEVAREEVQRGFFLFFHFLSKALSREDSITGEGGFPFCKTGREYRESEA